MGTPLSAALLSMYSDLFSVDFTEEDTNELVPAFFYAEMSFTFLDWLILERILLDADFDLSNLDPETQLIQCFNIYPGLQTVFHKLASTKLTNFDSNSISYLFENAAESHSWKGFNNRTWILPIIQDMNGLTPIDINFDKPKGVAIDLNPIY